MWDATSTGTLSNVIELLGRKKKSAVFVNKSKEFMTVGDVAQLQALVARMSEHARHKADEKLTLHRRIKALSREQLHMFRMGKEEGVATCLLRIIGTCGDAFRVHMHGKATANLLASFQSNVLSQFAELFEAFERGPCRNFAANHRWVFDRSELLSGNVHF